MRALHHGADDDAGSAGLARHLHHGGIADGEIGRAAEHGREGLGVAAGGGDFHLQAVLLEDAGMHADIEVDVAEVMHGLAEPDDLQAGGGGLRGTRQRTQRSPRCDRRGRGQEMAAADAGADIDKVADMICHARFLAE